MIVTEQTFEPIVRTLLSEHYEETMMGKHPSLFLNGEAVQGQVLVFDKSVDESVRVSENAFDNVAGIAYVPEPEKGYKIKYGQPVSFDFPRSARRLVSLKNFGMNKIAFIKTGEVVVRAGGPIIEGRQVVCSSNGTVILDNGVSYALPGSIVGTALETANPGNEFSVKLHIGKNEIF